MARISYVLNRLQSKCFCYSFSSETANIQSENCDLFGPFNAFVTNWNSFDFYNK